MHFKRLIFVLACLGLAALGSGAETPAAPPKQFLGILHLVSRLHSDTAWTKEDEAAVQRHFDRLKLAAEERKVIFAGRTTDSADKSMGLVVFEAADLAEAVKFMEEDPAVVAGVMVLEVRPYQIAVARKPAK